MDDAAERLTGLAQRAQHRGLADAGAAGDQPEPLPHADPDGLALLTVQVQPGAGAETRHPFVELGVGYLAGHEVADRRAGNHVADLPRDVALHHEGPGGLEDVARPEGGAVAQRQSDRLGRPRRRTPKQLSDRGAERVGSHAGVALLVAAIEDGLGGGDKAHRRVGGDADPAGGGVDRWPVGQCHHDVRVRPEPGHGVGSPQGDDLLGEAALEPVLGQPDHDVALGEPLAPRGDEGFRPLQRHDFRQGLCVAVAQQAVKLGAEPLPETARCRIADADEGRLLGEVADDRPAVVSGGRHSCHARHSSLTPAARRRSPRRRTAP